ncbi:hypothetical protein F4804DRAFT_317145 [Jackrogersella minutella]|nr:hypothetical protein F4804DRAFT_317145 [Jackrogersella minutella]
MPSTEDGKSDEGVLYFAYGSNLSPTQMLDRCPSSPPLGLVYLPGWTWLINERGYANIVQQNRTPVSSSSSFSLPYSTPIASEIRSLGPLTGENDGGKNLNVVQNKENGEKPEGMMETAENGVYGVLYRLHPEDEMILDACEGVPWAYERRFLDAMLVPSPTVTATITENDEKDASSRSAKHKMEKVQVLVYVDFKRVHPSAARYEYIHRMNRGIDDAILQWGLPESYVDAVMRPFIPAVESEKKG